MRYILCNIKKMRRLYLIYSLALFLRIRYNGGVNFSGYFKPMRINLDVLLILDALDKHGSFAAAVESLFKTPAALSYMIQKLENDLSIELLDRSGHRAKFTDTGRMMLEKGRLLLNAAKDLEKQAVQLSSGWEKELAIALDDSFPFSALLPSIEAFYALNMQTRLNFTHHTLAGSWEELTHNGADIILGAINEPAKVW